MVYDSVLIVDGHGCERKVVMLQHLCMVLPDVIGVKLVGALAKGVTATDLVLTIVEMLRKRGVVEKFRI